MCRQLEYSNKLFVSSHFWQNITFVKACDKYVQNDNVRKLPTREKIMKGVKYLVMSFWDFCLVTARKHFLSRISRHLQNLQIYANKYFQLVRCKLNFSRNKEAGSLCERVCSFANKYYNSWQTAGFSLNCHWYIIKQVCTSKIHNNLLCNVSCLQRKREITN